MDKTSIDGNWISSNPEEPFVIDGYEISNYTFDNIEASDSTVKNTTFTECVFINFSGFNASFINCKFVRCEFITSFFVGGSYKNNTVEDCKISINVSPQLPIEPEVISISYNPQDKPSEIMAESEYWSLEA